MTYVISRKTIYSAVLFFMVYIISFVRFQYFPYYNLVRYTFIVLSGLYILLNYRIVFKRKYMKINILLLLFSAVILFSSYLNVGGAEQRNPFLGAIVFVAVINILFYTAEYASETGNSNLMVKVYFFLCTLNIFITDVLLFLAPGLVEKYEGFYFIGNKFTVVFAHYLMMTLFLCRVRSGENRLLKQFVGFLMLLWTFFITVVVDCATGIVGCFVMAALLLIQSGGINLCSRKVFLISSAVVLIFPFMYNFVVDIPLVQSLIYSLNRNLTMTGRQSIFIFVISYMLYSPVIGFGFATILELGIRIWGITSTENCYLEWLWQTGIVGLVCLIVFLLAVISTINANAMHKKSYHFKAVNALIYTYLVLGTVLSLFYETFFGIVAIALALGTDEIFAGKMDGEYSPNGRDGISAECRDHSPEPFESSGRQTEVISSANRSSRTS